MDYKRLHLWSSLLSLHVRWSLLHIPEWCISLSQVHSWVWVSWWIFDVDGWRRGCSYRITTLHFSQIIECSIKWVEFDLKIILEISRCKRMNSQTKTHLNEKPDNWPTFFDMIYSRNPFSFKIISSFLTIHFYI